MFGEVKIGINQYLKVKIYAINWIAFVKESGVAFVYSGNDGAFLLYNSNIDFQDFNILGHRHAIYFRIHQKN